MSPSLPATLSLLACLCVVTDAGAQRVAPLDVVPSTPGGASTTPAATTPAATTPPPAVATTPPAVATAARAGPASNAFNPALSLILSGRYARTSLDPSTASIRGLTLPPDAGIGLGSRGFSLGESELGLSANIDPWLRGVAHVALGADDEVSVEEAYVQTIALDHGLTLKAGRFFSGVGYLNEQHAHVWDFADNPLAYQALLGTQYGDDGVQLRWLAPTDRFVQLGLEVGRGRSYPGSDPAGNGAGMFALSAHVGDDIGASQSWRAGLSLLRARAQDQALGFTGADGADLPGAFTGSTRVLIADAVWKWAPQGNPRSRNLKLQGEYLRATRSGSLAFEPSGDAPAADAPVGDYRVVQSGWYLQAVYQFMPRWRTGLRIERIASGAPSFGGDVSPAIAERAGAGKQTLMLEFNPSEFSRVRLQYARDRSRGDATDNQLLLQFIVSLGAHGAHGF
ncbi:MAG: hypothetical protein AB7P21_23300 [Lautropia sp.]